MDNIQKWLDDNPIENNVINSARKYQLCEWVKGTPIHNNEDDECCPDFSCCNGGKMVDLDSRKAFYIAVKESNETLKMEMLMIFLGNSFKDYNLYVTSGNPTEIQ